MRELNDDRGPGLILRQDGALIDGALIDDALICLTIAASFSMVSSLDDGTNAASTGHALISVSTVILLGPGPWIVGCAKLGHEADNPIKLSVG